MFKALQLVSVILAVVVVVSSQPVELAEAAGFKLGDVKGTLKAVTVSGKSVTGSDMVNVSR